MSATKLGSTGRSGLRRPFGVKADTLMRMQTTYDMAQARARAENIVVDRVLAAV